MTPQLSSRQVNVLETGESKWILDSSVGRNVSDSLISNTPTYSFFFIVVSFIFYNHCNIISAHCSDCLADSFLNRSSVILHSSRDIDCITDFSFDISFFCGILYFDGFAFHNYILVIAFTDPSCDSATASIFLNRSIVCIDKVSFFNNPPSRVSFKSR